MPEPSRLDPVRLRGILPIAGTEPLAELEALPDRFLAQGVALRSILVLGDRPAENSKADGLIEAALLELAGADRAILKHTTISLNTISLSDGQAVDALAQRARAQCAGVAGLDLLVVSTAELSTMLAPVEREFPFRAVATFAPRRGEDQHAVRGLQRDLFDRGLVCIGLVVAENAEARCFLQSELVQSPNLLGSGLPHRVSVSCLGRNGRFANQLFQYAYAKLYALRHGAIAAVPAWQGNQLYGLWDPPCAGLSLAQRTFQGFDDRHRLLWEEDEPPVDIDLNGYFQDLPACLGRHRSLIRRFFQLAADQQGAIDAWHAATTRDGARTLVAVHVRRGDYRLESAHLPWFRLVPEEWYLAWLRNIWPTLRDPLLYVATDEPEVVLPCFAEFAPISVEFAAPARGLLDYVRDFEILRRADYLAICNSSFSLMAAILAPAHQQCFIPSFSGQEFLPYQPWIDSAFWTRFATPDETAHAPLPLAAHR